MRRPRSLIGFTAWIVIALGTVVAVALVFTLTYPPVYTVQRGYRGTAMQEVFNPATIRHEIAANRLPPPQPQLPKAGQPASAVYRNVQVLGNLDATDFLRVMAAITTWVAPQQGCNYCHNPANLADDSLYTKRVARRMLQMVHVINSTYKTHVGAVGVTCYTCHRGNPVPSQIWFKDPGRPHFNGMVQAYIGGKDHPNPTDAMSSLPADVFEPYLDDAQSIRVASTTALPQGVQHSLKQAEWTYGLMIHFAQSLGVNCSYCHESRLFADWSQSTPQRVTAWWGIRMVRDLNRSYLDPLHTVFPKYRLGALGDSPKINCATCHQGVYKPLFGASMLADYPELAGDGPISATPAAVLGEVPGAHPPAPPPPAPVPAVPAKP